MKKKMTAIALAVLFGLLLAPMLAGSNASVAKADERKTGVETQLGEAMSMNRPVGLEGRDYICAASGTTTIRLSLQYGQTEARSISSMINEMRTSSADAWYFDYNNQKVACQNLSELKYDYDLERIAMQRAAEIALSFSHVRPNGRNCFSAYDVDCHSVGENIAVGYTTAASVNKGWREDNESYDGQGHRRNMLSSNYNCVGIAHVYYNGVHYWVEEFAKRDMVNTKATIANDKKQTVPVTALQSGVTNLKTNITLNQSSYSLKVNATLPVLLSKSSTTITYSGHWPEYSMPVVDTPKLGVKDTTIATYSDNKLVGVKAGTTKMTASLYGKKVTLSIPVTVTSNTSTAKKTPTIKAATTSKTIKYTALKKKAQTFGIGASTNSKGALTYKKTSGSAKLTINKSTGKVTVKKGTKKGTYKATIQVKAAAKGSYKAGSKSITIKVVVK